MAKKIKTIAFTDKAEKNLKLLMTDMQVHSASEVIRYAIDYLCVCRSLLPRESLRTYDKSMAAESHDKNQIFRQLEILSLQISQHNNRLDDIYRMCYEVRDGVNSQCKFMDPPFASADNGMNNYEPSGAIKASRDNYNTKMRNLAIDKANRR